MRVSNPTRLDDCFDETATYLAGGTDLMVAINFGRERPEHVLSLRRIAELKQLEANGRVRVGAGVSYTHLVRALGDGSPAMTQAARTVGSPQIRNAGTLGGNLGTCSPAGDTLPVLAALDATVVVRGRESERRLTLDRFMLGPKRSALARGEIVYAVEWDEAGPSQAFLKAGTRNAMVIAVASLAMVVDRGHKAVRLALGSVAPTIVRATAAEEFAHALLDEAGWERPLKLEEAAARRFGELAAEAATPIDDVRGTAAYRKHAVAVMAKRALQRAGAAT